MRFHAIACETLARECFQAGEKSQHVVDLYFLPFGSHDNPEKMRGLLQKTIDEVSGRCDYILLAFGLCGGGTAGLVARETPLVIPRAHECITILLGSKDLYLREFGAHPKTYYFMPGWIDRKGGHRDMHVLTGAAAQSRHQEWAEKYGRENAAYLAQQEREWQAHYDRAAFVNTGLGDVQRYRGFTERLAAERGWAYTEIPGDLGFIDALFAGDWDPEKFLVVQHGQRTAMDYNSHVIVAV